MYDGMGTNVLAVASVDSRKQRAQGAAHNRGTKGGEFSPFGEVKSNSASSDF